jgi:hypothetical protein
VRLVAIVSVVVGSAGACQVVEELAVTVSQVAHAHLLDALCGRRIARERHNQRVGARRRHACEPHGAQLHVAWTL